MPSNDSAADRTFDFVVVGSGTAGSVVAERLSASGRHAVLVLETGGHDDWHQYRVPAGVAWVLGGDRGVTHFRTAAEAQLGDRSIALPRGTLVGGTSRINGMIWGRGEPAEYDAWSASGLDGWAYRDVAPWFDRIEHYGPLGRARARRAHGGPMRISDHASPEPLSEAFLDACARIGVDRVPNYNAGPYGGAGYLQFNRRHGLRWSVYEAYLKPALRRSNVTLRTDATVRRVLIEEGRAVGVEFDEGPRRHVVRATREVVICAGAIASPQLLELSGIGDPERLARLGIATRAALPGVGENLRDHLQARLAYRVRGVVTLNDLLHRRLSRYREVWRYATTRRGLLAATSCTAQALLSRAGPGHRPDLKLQLYHMTNVSAEPSADGRPMLDRDSGFSIGVIPLRPKSTGSVHARSPDVREPPRIEARYLSERDDRDAMVDGFRIARSLVAAAPFDALHAREISPGAAADSDARILEHVARTASTSYHPIGTCRMGVDRLAVVDARLRVHGVRGLRVADASVMPTLVSQNTHAPTILIGERLADFVLADAQRSPADDLPPPPVASRDRVA